MVKYFFIGLLLYAFFSLIKSLLVFLVSKYYKEAYVDNVDFDFKVFFFEAIAYSFIFSGFGMIDDFRSTNERYSILASVFLITLVPTYAFVISPLRFLFLNKKYLSDINLNQLVASEALNYKIRVIDANVINAYATGILPFTKTILIGKPLVNSLSEIELKSIIFHEIGHLHKKHLSKLYFVSILVVVFSYFIFLLRSKFQFGNELLNIASIGLVGAMMGLLIWIIPGRIQHQFEYEADLFSCRKNGRKNLIDALEKLDALSNGEVSKGGISHPTLSKRIQKLNGEL
ncbi:MAG: M48 family metallopeptidase [Sphingobacteriales bacterium]